MKNKIPNYLDNVISLIAWFSVLVSITLSVIIYFSNPDLFSSLTASPIRRALIPMGALILILLALAQTKKDFLPVSREPLFPVLVIFMDILVLLLLAGSLYVG